MHTAVQPRASVAMGVEDMCARPESTIVVTDVLVRHVIVGCTNKPASWAAILRAGKYSIAKTVFDPLGLATKYDLNWLREAEIKCVPTTFSVWHSGRNCSRPTQ